MLFRSSVTGQTLHDLFNRQSSAPQPYPGAMASAVNAQRRRLSLTTVGLTATGSQTSPFQSARPRTESLSSANSGSVDESPFEDDPAPSASSNPATPFARRLSFGARALRDVRQSNGSLGNSNGRPSIPRKASSPPTAKGRGLSSSLSPPSSRPQSVASNAPASLSASSSFHSAAFPSSFSVLVQRFKQHPNDALGEHELTSLLSTTGEGYNFAENLRSRAERVSFSSVHPVHPAPRVDHQRAQSVTVMEPPVREMPKQPRVPDAMQERILKGDFYMD